MTLLDLLLEPHRLNPLRVSLAMEFCVALQRVELLMARVLPAIRPTDLSSRKGPTHLGPSIPPLMPSVWQRSSPL